MSWVKMASPVNGRIADIPKSAVDKYKEQGWKIATKKEIAAAEETEES